MINDIKPNHLIQFYSMLKEDGVRLDGKPGGLSITTIKHHHTLISSMFEYALTWELATFNPSSRVKLSKLGFSNRDSKRITEEMIYSIEQIKVLLKLIDAEDIKYRTLINLAIFTGCRREELMGLEWKDIDLNTGKIKIIRSSQYNIHDGVYEDGLKTYKSKRVCQVPNKVISLLKIYKNWWE